MNRTAAYFMLLPWFALMSAHPAVSETLVRPTASGDDMQPGEMLAPGQFIRSPDGRYTLAYQGDGNLVLNGPGGPLWASNTGGRSIGAAIMEDDGNLAVYGSDFVNAWDSATDGNPGSRLVVQDDGNVVILRPDGARVWTTDTAVRPTPATASGDDMLPGETLPPGYAIRSPDGRYAFVYQGDGNLVLNGPAGPLWASNTGGKPVGAAVMQDDGKLVVRGPDAAELWASATGDPGSRLVVRDDGNVVVERPDGTQVWTTDTAVRPTPATASGDDMLPGEALPPGFAVQSADGRYTFIYQGDGNLVLNGPAGPMWASNTGGKPVGAVVMQDDGKLVVRGPDAAEVWASATGGNPGSRLVVRDDGNVVIERPDGTQVWATGTAVRPAPPTASGDDMQPGEALPPGFAIRSPDGRYTFVYQGDGNLVLYGPTGPLWASNTGGRPVGAAIMGDDGKLVVYGSDSAVVWASATGDPGSRLVVRDDGNVVIQRPDGAAVWGTDTVQP